MIRFFTEHPNAANLLMLCIIALGVTGLSHLKRDTFPELKNVRVQVQAIYKGATPEEVEDAVCRRIEEAVEGITNLKETQCDSREGLAIATIEMVEKGEMTTFLDDVKSEVDIISDFPDDVEEPIVTEIGRTAFLASIAVTGPDNPVDLKAYSETIKTRLQAMPGIAKTEIRGFSDRQIRIEVPSKQLEQLGLSAVEVSNAIKEQSVGIPVGEIESPNENVILRFDDQRKTVNSFRDVVIVSALGGAEVRLGDIAKISNTFDNSDSKVIFNGQKAALIDVYKAKSDDVLSIIGQVKTFIEDERTRIPDTISLTLSRDTASVVKGRLDILVSNGIQGLILVVIILGLFFSVRFSFWVAMGLPVSFLGSLFVMSLLDMSLNQISLVGLLIAIGLLMDDAIVISENIANRLQKGETASAAAINGVSEVLPGILSSFATTIFIFGALIFLDGNLGQILGVLPVVLITTLAVSLVEAFFILPNHLSHSLKHLKREEPSRFKVSFERKFESFRDNLYGSLLDLAIKWRYVTIGLVVMALLISFSLIAGGTLKVRGFPDVEGDIIEARILLPQGTPLSRTEEVANHLVKSLSLVNEEYSPQQPNKVNLIQNTAVLYSTNDDSYETGPHVVTISADLLSAEIRKTTIDEIFSKWRGINGNLPDVISVKYTESSVGPAGRAIDLRFGGMDLNILKAASNEVVSFLSRYDGVNDLSDDLRPGKREFRLHLKEGASALGLTAKNISEQVRTQFQGIVIDEFPVGTETYEVTLQTDLSDRNSMQDFEELNLVGSGGILIPLKSIVEIEEVRGWARINRYNGLRTVSVQGDVDTRITNTAEVLSAFNTQLLPDILKRYPSITFNLEGESSNSAETRRSMGVNMLIGLLGVYILLAFQFRSYFVPILVMAVIPTAFIGVIWGHFLMGLELSLPSLIGGAALAGVVVNNSILMMQFIRNKRKEGADTLEAASYAGRIRFRAIVLTTLTTVVGLLPLLFERSTQAQILTPLATSLAFGLMVATILSLFLMPALYCVMDDLNLVNEANEGENKK